MYIPLRSLGKVVKDMFQKEDTLSRRDLIIGFLEMAGLCSVGSLGGGYALASRKTSMDRLLLEFPDQIPHAFKIKKYPMSDAHHCLVHVKQSHYLDEKLLLKMGYVLTEENIKEINSCQKDIYHILDFLIKSVDLKGVYKEGLVPEELPEFEKVKKKLLGRVVDGFVLRENDHAVPAGYQLYIQNKLEIYPGDTVENLELAKKEMLQKKMGPACLDNREDSLLEVIAGQEERLAVVIFGKVHSWRNNIYHWNEKYPDHKFALIEITPETIKNRTTELGKIR